MAEVQVRMTCRSLFQKSDDMKILVNRLLLVTLLLLGLNCVLMAQSGAVRGTIYDDEGNPLPGSVVYVKGTAKGTVAGVDGAYSLTGLTSGAVLVYSYYPLEEERVWNGENVLDVTLQNSSVMLEETVVVGYGQTRKEDVTGSLTSVKVDDISRGFTASAQDLLVGKVAGVSIINEGGAPGGNSYIRIRGGSSLSANNEPLIILDGVYIDSQGINGAGNILSTINPHDIASFTVLKDASATAIYGSRASNGVILITTKKGTDAGLKVSYDGNMSVSHLKRKLDVLTGDEFRVFLKESFGETVMYQSMKDRQGLVNTDWQDVIFKTAINTEHNLSMYGSVRDWLPYRISAGYSRQDGILKTSKTERYTASISLSPEFFDRHLKVELNGRGNVSDNRFADWSAIGAAVTMDPTQAVYDKDSPYGGFFTWVGEDRKIIQVATKNPLSTLEMLSDKARVYNFKGNASIDYKVHFLPDLRLNVNGSLDISESSGRKYYDPWMPSDYMYGGYDSNWTQSVSNSSLTASARYEKKFNGFHFDLMCGYKWQHYWRKGYTTGYRITQYESDGDPILVEDHGYENEHYLISFFGRLNLNILDRYLLTFTLREDGSSRFSEKHRWALFPSVALAWRISQEPFMKSQSLVSNLKLRLGWGVTGQQEINIDYGHLRTYLHSTGTEVGYIRGFFEGEPIWSALLRPESYNPDLRWESTVTLNAGLDFGLWKGRLDGTVDVYHRQTNDLINLQTKTTAGTNFKEFVATNIGALVNKGVELTLNGVMFDKKDFGWDIGANLTYNRNVITKLNDGDDSDVRLQNGVTVNMVGQAANTYYVYEQLYDEKGKPIEGLYRDINGDGEISADDLRPYKKAAPDWTLGLNTKLRWKRLDLTVSGHGNFGTYNYNAVAASGSALSATSVYVSETLVNRLRCALDTGFQIPQPYSDYFIQNASFFRIDSVVLGWTFDSLFKSRANGRIYLNVQNPLVMTSYTGLDPEVFGGHDGTLYPRPITYMLGVTFNF